MKKRLTDEETVARLVERFMAGETSREEESLLADYFRSHNVGAEWLPYKEMFDYFDAGMPLPKPLRRRPRRAMRTAWTAAAAAAALALLVAGLGLQHGTGGTSDAGPATPSPEATVAAALATADSARATTARGAARDTVQPHPTLAPKPKATPGRKRYAAPPPKPLLASADKAQQEADSLAEARVREVARRQALAMEVIELLGEMQAKAAGDMADALAESYGEDEIVY